MNISYSDNVLIYFFKVLAVFSIYGVFSATLFFFLIIFLIFLYVHRRLSSLRLYDDDENLPKYANSLPHDAYGYESISITHNQYFVVLKALFYFYSFLWVLTYFGITKALYLYILLSLLFYTYLYIRRDFRGYERSYLNKISLLDPRPGFFSSSNNFSNDDFVFGFLQDSGLKPFLDTRYQILRSPKVAGNYGGVNAFNIALTKDPHFLSKLLYYYADVFIYNSIHNFWLAVSEVGSMVVRERVFKSPEDYVGRTHMRFYPKEHFGLADTLKQSLPSASYIKSQTFVFNTLKDVYRITAFEAFSDSLYLRYLDDPFFRLGVPVSNNSSSFPNYKEDSLKFFAFRSTFESFLLSPYRLEFLFHSVRRGLIVNKGLLRKTTSNFNIKVKNIIFNMFPRVYYFKWLSSFLSFFTAETSLNFRFKNVLIPEHWYNFLSMYRYKRKPSRSRAGLHFSRLGTGQIVYNTDYTYKRGILEFIFNSCLYPINNRWKNYYYLNGFTRFNILESFDFANLLLEPFFMFPVKAYFNRMRAYMKDSQILDFREPLKVFEIRRFIRKSGDGMEPFLSIGHFMYTSNVDFINDLGCVALNDRFDNNIPYDFYTESLPVFSSLANNSTMLAFRNFGFKLDRSANIALFMDPNWSVLKSAVESNPSLKIYLKNLAYNKCSSEFYEWFSDRHSSKPFFHLYELSLELLIKSPFFFKILESASELPITGNDSVFNNYQNLLNRVALKLEPSYKKVTGGDTKSFVFSLNRIRRSIVKETFLSRPLYKKSYVYFKQLPPVSLNLFSPFSILKFANFELLEKRSVRSKLRVLLRDPFLFLNKSGKAGKGMVFRRFLWSNIFLKSTLTASLEADTPSKDFSKSLSAFLLKKLSLWLQNRYGFPPTYINYIFSDLTIFRDYVFFLRKEGAYFKGLEFQYKYSEILALWHDLSKNQFDMKLWKSYLDLLFADNHFYSYSTSRKVGVTIALSNLLLDSKLSMDFLIEIKNNYILQFPTKYMNFLAIRSSEGSMNFGRGTWGLFVSTLNALTYLLIKSLLSGNKPRSGESFDNFLILMEQLKQDSKAYNYIAKHLFLTLDPLYDFKRMSNIVPEDTGLFLSSLHKVKGVDWWESIPNNTVFKAVEHVLADQLEFPVTDKHRFCPHMFEFWDDYSKFNFVTSLKNLSLTGVSSNLILKIFNSRTTRASAVLAISDSSLDIRLKKVAYTILLNEFKAQDTDCSDLTRKYNESVWKLDSFYGFTDLSHFFFDSKVVDSSYTESHFSDARFFYNRDIESSLSMHRTPIGFRSRVGAFRSSQLFSLNSFNNTFRSSWYYSIFTRKPFFHHERLSLKILNSGNYVFLSNPTVNVRFYNVSFFYFGLYWFVKQLSLFLTATVRYFIKHYRYNCIYDPLNES